MNHRCYACGPGEARVRLALRHLFAGIYYAKGLLVPACERCGTLSINARWARRIDRALGRRSA